MITYPLALFAMICLAIFWLREPEWYREWPKGLLFFVAYLVAYRDVFNIVIWRSAFTVAVTDVPLVLALFYLPPVMVILVVGGAILVQQLWSHAQPAKMAFNTAKSAAGNSAALLLILALPEIRGRRAGHVGDPGSRRGHRRARRAAQPGRCAEPGPRLADRP
ncbi:hypothetical protein Aph02nite_50380 [Actinoplanes philippinensis]|nr:hypothetical protein [Actinoplanes philippinensis]GIE79088.1 hypothetical protein Aph02nite_50380 [Actinoplanes philippinensis]